MLNSSCSHTWDAFQLALASFKLYCFGSDSAASPSDSQVGNGKSMPHLLGEPPKIDIALPEEEDLLGEDGESLPAIKIYDEEISIRLLICGVPCVVVSLLELA